MPGDLCMAPDIISLSYLSLADRRDWRDYQGKWSLARNQDRSWWHRHISLKVFWPQPMAPWTAWPNDQHLNFASSNSKNSPPAQSNLVLHNKWFSLFNCWTAQYIKYVILNIYSFFMIFVEKMANMRIGNLRFTKGISCSLNENSLATEST